MTDPDPRSEARRQLLEKIRRNEFPVSNGTLPPLVPRPRGGQAPASPGQEQVWFHSEMAGSIPIYNESVTIHKRGPLDRVVLEHCFNEIARRHEITSQHLFAWRKAARQGRVVLPAETVPAFVPVVTVPPASTGGARSDGTRAITIEIGGVVVRAEPGVDLRLLRDVLRAVKAAT